MLLNKKGFTMIEMLTALLLLGLLMTGISAVMSSLSAVTETADQDTNPNNNAIYILQELQQDALVAVTAKCDDGELLLLNSEGEATCYEVSSNKLYRQSRYLADVIKGEFSSDDDSFSIRIILSSHEVLETRFYLKGAK